MIALDEIAEMVQERCGFAPAPALLTALRRTVTHRCVEMGGVTADDYLALLRVSSEEFSILTHELIVPETFFFRYPESFAALRTWVKEHKSRPLRVLSAACSTGEEAYTIAMALFSEGLDASEFVVEGWDLNPASVATAREGYYSANSFRSGSMGWRERFFIKKTEGWLAGPSLRNAVHFKTANLLDVMNHDAWDAIFCRNALIYFSPAQQQKVVKHLDRALISGGILFLGPAEPALFLEHNWVSAKFPMSFACIRRSRDDARLGASHSPSPRPSAPSVNKSRSAVAVTRRHPAPVIAPSEVLPPPLPLLERAHGHADEGRLDEAQALLGEILQKESGHVEANFLMGIVEEARGRMAVAESCYRRVLFLLPSHLGALQHMKLLLRAQGREQAAERLGHRAARHHTSP